MGKLSMKLSQLRDSLSDRLGIVKKVRTSPRKGTSTRKVHFGPVKVTEFERLLCGGGGVPDGDVVSLGLGRPVRSYETVPRDRPRTADKDTYCMRGCLDVRRRAELLCQWMRKKDYLVLLRKLVKPQLLRVQRGREASNAVPVHCRDMPASLAEAVAVARVDESVALRGLQQATIRAAPSAPPTSAGTRKKGAAGEPEAEAEGEEAEHAVLPLGNQAQLSAHRKHSGKPIRSPKRVRTAPGDAAADGESGLELEGEEEEADDDEEEADDGEQACTAAGVDERASGARAHKRAARLISDGAGAHSVTGLHVWEADVVGQRFVGANAALQDAAGRRPAGRGALGDISRWLVWRDF